MRNFVQRRDFVMGHSTLRAGNGPAKPTRRGRPDKERPMRKLTEYPTLSLHERDRRWMRVRAEMDARGLDALVLCGWPAMWDFNVANARYLCPIGGNSEHNVLVFPRDGE